MASGHDPGVGVFSNGKGEDDWIGEVKGWFIGEWVLVCLILMPEAALQALGNFRTSADGSEAGVNDDS